MTTVRVLPPQPGGPELLLLHAADPAELRAAARASTGRYSAQWHVSRSYAAPWALVGAHGAPVGVDVERVTAWTPDEVRSMLAPGESSGRPDGDATELWPSRHATDPSSGQHATDLWSSRHATDVWSGKEALAKALGDAVGYDPRRLASPASWRDGRAGRWRAWRIDVAADHVGWVVWATDG